jgi:hypothetical protein
LGRANSLRVIAIRRENTDLNRMDPNLKSGLLIALGLLSVAAVMVLLARWARRGSKGAIISGALLSMFAPDPELEKNIRLAEEARQEQHEEEEEGQDRDAL